MTEADNLWKAMTPEQRTLTVRVKELLQQASRDNPIPGKQLAPKLIGEGDNRPIRIAIRYLRLAPSDDGMPCSRNRKKGGYWWSNDPADIEETRQHLRSRLRELATLCSAISKKRIRATHLRMGL